MKRARAITRCIKRKILLLLVASAVLSACSGETSNQSEDTAAIAEQLPQDAFLIRGTYRWTFKLAGFTQVSIHSFAEEHIDYSMEGRVHSTEYTMQMVSYDAGDRKWIGYDGEHHYAMFIDPQEDGRLRIYKHKVKNLEEAVAFARPDPDATADHGWNDYTSAGDEERSDSLPLEATYTSGDGSDSIILSDESVTHAGIDYAKVTYHDGERRWVGGNGSSYLLVFWRSEDPAFDRIEVYTETADDAEHPYTIKQSDVESTSWRVLRRE